MASAEGQDYRKIADQRYPDKGKNIVIRRRDITSAIPADPLHCTIANAGRREQHAILVVAIRTRAAIVYEKNGHQWVENYEYGPTAKTIVRMTDIAAEKGVAVESLVPDGLVADLIPLRKSYRPDAVRVRNAKRPNGRAKNPGARPNAGRRSDPLRAFGVRDGAGLRFEVPPPRRPFQSRLPYADAASSGSTSGPA